jgi:DNA-binding transcriptional LysR family regulator
VFPEAIIAQKKVYKKRTSGYDCFHMDINRLLQFRVIVATGNLRKASELLGISNGGLSKSMKVLESELGLTLLQPSGRGIVISDDGMRFFERSKRFLDEYEKLMSGDTATDNSVLRIGSFEVFTSYFIGPLLKQYLPALDVEVHELLPGRLEEALLYNKVDVGMTYEPVPRKGIDYVKVTTIAMGAFGLHGQFQNMDLLQIPFIVPVNPLESAPSGVKGRDGWPDDKIHRKIRYRVDLMATGLELARQGLAAIFIPRFVARLHNERVPASLRLEALKLPRGVSNVHRPVYIVTRESTVEDTVIRQMAHALRRVCTEPKHDAGS